MVFHIAAVHHINPVAGFHHSLGGDDSVVQRYQYGCGLEGGARFHHVRDGIVAYLSVNAVIAFGHVYNGFDVSRLHFHQDGDAYGGVDFFQFIHQCFLCNVLHTYINGGDDIATIYRGDIHDVQVFVHYLLTVGDPVSTFQYGVV